MRYICYSFFWNLFFVVVVVVVVIVVVVCLFVPSSFFGLKFEFLDSASSGHDVSVCWALHNQLNILFLWFQLSATEV